MPATFLAPRWFPTGTLSHDAVASKRLHDGLRKQPLRLTGEHVAYSMKTIHDVFL
ncbi:hypothetical protein JCM19046_2091 [Bacillus sp. JCM 19046]|nr:hypothetical protein JCM19045_4147 [Bacillus sp. JCM 19045]GAF17571.1 hypothetical protein JCM19046_2091 [Bacillus sp. JCM 19046]